MKNLLNGLAQIQLLSNRKQFRFEKYLDHQIKFRILPVACDLSLLLTFIGTCFHIATLIKHDGFASVHPLNYVYLGFFILIAALHQHKRLRRAAPTVVYLTYANMAIFTYLGYLATRGDITSLIGLFFYLSTLGFITLSLKHTIIILGSNLLLLIIATKLAKPQESLIALIFTLIGNWFIFMCLVAAPLSAIFNRWLISQLLALQYLLNERNRQLARTLTSLKRTEQALITQQKHQALSHMAAGLLHEIINPLNSANQALEYAKMQDTSPEIDESLSDAILHQNRIVQLVSDLKQFSASGNDIVLKQENISALVHKALSFCKPALTSIAVDVTVPKDFTLNVHPPSLLQVFTNLINNSAKALDHTKQPTLSISVNKTHQYQDIIVRDNGCGIEKSQIEKIVDPFYSTSQAPDNIGLGLSICLTIMRHHGGQLLIDSELGEYTCVSLRFLEAH